jgi:hypothetical protein
MMMIQRPSYYVQPAAGDDQTTTNERDNTSLVLGNSKKAKMKKSMKGLEITQNKRKRTLMYWGTMTQRDIFITGAV